MTVQAQVLGQGPMQAVRLVVTGVPNGVEWSLHGTSNNGEWLVASGRSIGSQIVTLDPWAPLGIPATYRLTYGSVAQTVGPVTRTYTQWSAITDLTGRTVADVLWDDDGGDPRESVRGVHSSNVPGARYQPMRLDPRAGAGGGSVVVRAVRPDADTLQALLDTNKPLILLHNEARCDIPGCVVAPVRTIVVTSDPNDLTPRIDQGERRWTLRYQLKAPGVRGGVVAVATLGDLKAKFATLGALKATGMTLGDLARGDWLFDQ